MNEQELNEQLNHTELRLQLWIDYLTHETFRPVSDIAGLIDVFREADTVKNGTLEQKQDWIRRAKAEIEK